jgi:hypothetical protein
MPLPRKRWPKATRKNACKYSRDSIQKMVEAADTDEKDKYPDIDFKRVTINVHDKPDFGWTVKDHEQRSQDIVLPEKFVKRMEGREGSIRAKMSELIFPIGAANKPNQHLIRIAQRAVRSPAWKNGSHCTSFVGLSELS